MTTKKGMLEIQYAKNPCPFSVVLHLSPGHVDLMASQALWTCSLLVFFPLDHQACLLLESCGLVGSGETRRVSEDRMRPLSRNK